MEKLYYYLLSAVLLAGVGAVIVECGGSVCGNGVLESGEQCDKGMQNGVSGSGCSATCQSVGIPRASVQVNFSLFLTESPGYAGSDCQDLGIDHWSLHLDGPTTDDQPNLGCLNKTKIYDSVMPGMYTATITLFDAAGNALTKMVKTATLEADLGGTAAMLYHDFLQVDFLKQDYQGVLLFDPNWGATGGSCTSANPTVAQEAVTLSKMGTPVAGMTLDGLSLDGTFGPCFMHSTSASAQKVSMQLPWGHYDLTLQGKDGGGALAYCQKYDVFVPAGTAPNAYELVVQSVGAENPDGGSCP